MHGEKVAYRNVADTGAAELADDSGPKLADAAEKEGPTGGSPDDLGPKLVDEKAGPDAAVQAGLVTMLFDASQGEDGGADAASSNSRGPRRRRR